jgi:hypothetical protein
VGLAVIELLMVCFITPAVTAGTISGEKERLTYEMLLATPLRPASILRGKLLSALGYVSLLILASVPMSSLIFTFGGVTVLDMVKVLILLTAMAFTLGVIGVTLSAWLERTVRATVLSYLAVLGMLVGPLLLYVLVGVLRQSLPPPWLLIPNPLSALFSALPLGSGGRSSLGFAGELGRLLTGGVWMDAEGIAWRLSRPLYHYSLAFYAALSLGLYLLATRLVRPTRRWRITWKEVGTALASFLVLAAAIVVFFVATASRYQGDGLRTTHKSVPTTERPVQRVEVMVEREVVPIATPTPAPPPLTAIPSPTLTAVLTADMAGLYSKVIRQLYAASREYDEAPKLEALTVARAADDKGLLAAPDAFAPISISAQTQSDVSEALDDLGPKIVWVDDQAAITLGDVHLTESGTVEVFALFQPTSEVQIGKTYLLERVEDVWQIVGEVTE